MLHTRVPRVPQAAAAVYSAQFSAVRRPLSISRWSFYTPQAEKARNTQSKNSRNFEQDLRSLASIVNSQATSYTPPQADRARSKHSRNSWNLEQDLGLAASIVNSLLPPRKVHDEAGTCQKNRLRKNPRSRGRS